MKHWRTILSWEMIQEGVFHPEDPIVMLDVTEKARTWFSHDQSLVVLPGEKGKVVKFPVYVGDEVFVAVRWDKAPTIECLATPDTIEHA